mmetsp:Transcript_3370/g.15060  ORF Transcript_3370/g.15060 Transcript_3370/m.15060 type:complete len:378 (-) Transcript_3370:46-1179(-)
MRTDRRRSFGSCFGMSSYTTGRSDRVTRCGASPVAPKKSGHLPVSCTSIYIRQCFSFARVGRGGFLHFFSRLCVVGVRIWSLPRGSERHDERQQHLVLVRALLLDEVCGEVLRERRLPRVLRQRLVPVVRTRYLLERRPLQLVKVHVRPARRVLHRPAPLAPFTRGEREPQAVGFAPMRGGARGSPVAGFSRPFAASIRVARVFILVRTAGPAGCERRRRVVVVVVGRVDLVAGGECDDGEGVPLQPALVSVGQFQPVPSSEAHSLLHHARQADERALRAVVARHANLGVLAQQGQSLIVEIVASSLFLPFRRHYDRRRRPRVLSRASPRRESDRRIFQLPRPAKEWPKKNLRQQGVASFLSSGATPIRTPPIRVER